VNTEPGTDCEWQTLVLHSVKRIGSNFGTLFRLLCSTSLLPLRKSSKQLLMWDLHCIRCARSLKIAVDAAAVLDSLLTHCFVWASSKHYSSVRPKTRLQVVSPTDIAANLRQAEQVSTSAMAFHMRGIKNFHCLTVSSSLVGGTNETPIDRCELQQYAKLISCYSNVACDLSNDTS
jgi:hypothetical protein